MATNSGPSLSALEAMAIWVYSQPPLDMGTLDDDDHLVFNAGGPCEMRIPCTPEFAKQLRQDKKAKNRGCE